MSEGEKRESISSEGKSDAAAASNVWILCFFKSKSKINKIFTCQSNNNVVVKIGMVGEGTVFRCS